LWRRSQITWPDGRRDATSLVLWLQGIKAFGDLRRPASLAFFPPARVLGDLSRQDCLRLAEQQGFAGRLTYDGRHFEWERVIDFQPKGVHADAGSLRWENSVLIEEGRDVDYVENWHREPIAATEPVAALLLRESMRGIKALIVRVGNHFVFARDRAVSLPPHTTLVECVEGAATVEQARNMVDCEISLGTVSAQRFSITASTLPYGVGEFLDVGRGHPWEILEGEGPLTALHGAIPSALAGA
jgi:hypothetical protein